MNKNRLNTKTKLLNTIEANVIKNTKGVDVYLGNINYGYNPGDIIDANGIYDLVQQNNIKDILSISNSEIDNICNI